MDAAAAGGEPIAARFDGLHAEAKAALAYSANTLRTVRDRYREAHAEELARWHELRGAVEAAEQEGRPTPRSIDRVHQSGSAEAGTDDLRVRALRREVDRGSAELRIHETELGRLELATRSLESTWLFLERGDGTLMADSVSGGESPEIQMRIVAAQEAERSRLAHEVHDGPAQALSNAIFQVQYIEKVIGPDRRLAAAELRLLRERLRRDLGEVRSFITQLRPPVLERLGLDGALREALEQLTAFTGIPVEADLTASTEQLRDGERTVVLRVVQEALQNVRKHASAASVSVATGIEDGAWVLEVRDDGRGFDLGAVAARGRRNFGLQFMRERAELIGARLDVRSRPEGGTIVRLAIPMGAEETT